MNILENFNINSDIQAQHISKNTALLLVSSGTDSDSAPAYLQALKAITARLRSDLCGIQIYNAIADQKLLREMDRASRAGARTGESFMGVQEALERIKTDGYMTTYVQPLFLMPGRDTDAMDEEIDARISYGCFSSISRGVSLPHQLCDFSKIQGFACDPGSYDFTNAIDTITSALISALCHEA